MTTMTANRNISTCTQCFKAGTGQCKPLTCKQCSDNKPAEKQNDQKQRDLIQELADKGNIAKGFQLLQLSENETGEYSL